jgi:hypothetical protein
MSTNVLGVVVIVVIVGVLLFLFLDPLKRKDTWKELADSLDMNYEAKNLRKGMFSAKVSGEFRGRSLLLNTTRSANEFQTLYTQIQVPVENPEGNSLSLSQRNIFTEAVKKLGVPYIPTGDDEFDQRFVVVAKPENFIRTILGSPYIRQKLLRTRKLDINLVESNLNFRVRGFVKDLETLLELIELINEIADRIEKKALQKTSFSLN